MLAPSRAPGRDGRLGMLDLLRFLAAFAVVAFHFTARDSPAWGGPVPEEIAGVGQWAAYGRLGVPLFFVISGFVILMSSWGRDIPAFVASRIGRLFPAYWVSVVVSAGIVLVLWPQNPAFFGSKVTASDAVLNLTMVQPAFGAAHMSGVYWTLWYEARFYLLIALLMLIGITRTRVLAFAALWPVLGAVAAQADSNLLSTLLLPTYAPFFAGGMLIYVLHRDGSDWGTWLLLALQGAIGLHYSLNIHEHALAALTPWQPSTIVIALLTFACFGLVALVTLTRVSLWNARWMTTAGALTYPIYLIHENLGWYVIDRVRGSLGAWGAVAAAFAVALVASVLMHQLIEKPFGPRLRRAVLAMLKRPAPRAAVLSRGGDGRLYDERGPLGDDRPDGDFDEDFEEDFEEQFEGEFEADFHAEPANAMRRHEPDEWERGPMTAPIRLPAAAPLGTAPVGTAPVGTAPVGAGRHSG